MIRIGASRNGRADEIHRKKHITCCDSGVVLWGWAEVNSMMQPRTKYLILHCNDGKATLYMGKQPGAFIKRRRCVND